MYSLIQKSKKKTVIKKTALFLTMLLSASFSYAQGIQQNPRFNTSFYGGEINYYNDNYKDKAYDGGVFFSSLFKTDYGPLKISLDAERFYLKYKNKIDNRNGFSQNDFTGRVDIFPKNHLTTGIVFHRTYITQQSSDFAKNPWSVGISGGYCKPYKYNIKTSLYYSSFNNSKNGENTIRVLQISPSIGAFLYVPSNYYYYKTWGSFYLNMTLDCQKFIKNRDNFNKDKYVSGEISLANYHENFNIKASVELGNSVYKVLNDGFVLRDANEKVTSGYSLSFTYNFINNISLTVKYSNQRAKYPDGGNSKRNMMLGYLNYSF